MNNKFKIGNNSESLNTYNDFVDGQSPKIGVFEIGIVADYKHAQRTGLIRHNGTLLAFKNVTNIALQATDKVILGYASGASEMICIGLYESDINKSLVYYVPTLTATGLTFSGTEGTYPTSGSYYSKNGNIVSFAIKISMATVTNFGTGQYKTELPFPPLSGMYNHFAGWIWLDKTVDPDLSEHSIINADHKNSGNRVLDLHWLAAASANPKQIKEEVFKQGSPSTLTTNTEIYINGTYLVGE